ncbi:O-antigen ligase family protein [Ramlibacter humi]|uniref:O-antigen ligase-related domain-containing protein n=1 Tax=Ramlibacter humi TaxID=2530451 RepID=A0A4Z0CDE9_9BURK|nr:O-antigen ligase family protein [Ramlibacter humi]TFZ08229.1 hypothetical protein EZ216_03450 [Ramlibacter humi]
MGRQRRRSAERAAAREAATAAPVIAAPATASGTSAGVVWLLAAALFLAPALGVPSELMLQDTLKSIVVSFAALAAALVFFWQQRGALREVRWHPVLWLPLLLMAYALGSMAWSHAYLGGVEAIRWFVFSLILWLGLQAFTPGRLPVLAAAIHGGAVVASLWAALQFWGEFTLFPQGPNPASTFVNRNFFAEFVVCTLPFGALLLARARTMPGTVILAATNALVVLAILMTGTRAALISLWLQLLAVLPFIAWRFRSQAVPWPKARVGVAAAVLLVGVIGLGSIPSNNESLLKEGRGTTALQRGFNRTASIGPNDESLNLRKVMWAATLRMIADRPVSGVGAGAWEVQVPRYQADGEQLETDYYVHNEVLQLLAEDGVVGLVFLAGLFGYLLLSAWRTWRAGSASEEGPLRAVALASLLSLMVVSNVGFPWRMAATGALFAACLGLLAASDARIGFGGRIRARTAAWRTGWTSPALVGTTLALALAVFITWEAAECERKLVRAAQLATSISREANPNDPKWDGARAEMLQLLREGIAINRHYRKITPIAADEMANWGDWKDALWVWQSVLSSRPYVVAIITNVARGYASLNQPDQAFEYLERARAVSPHAPSVLSLEVILYSRFRDAREAAKLARQALDLGRYDYDLLFNAFRLGLRTGDSALSRDALQKLAAQYPSSRPQVLLELGRFHLEVEKVEANAIASWRQALAATPPEQRELLLQQIPPEYRAQVAR